jgi:hypothetical protein
MHASSFSNSRTGKIGRLPRAIRQQLNERLADGESSQVLVAWLNDCEVVQERLAQYFGGRPITEHNLSDWKQGGFQDWLRHQEARGMLREFLNEAEELAAELEDEDGAGLTDRVTEMVAMVLVKLFKEVAEAEGGPEKRKAVLEISREISRLRRGDHQRARVRLQVDRERQKMDAEEESREAEKERKREGRMAMLLAMGSGYRSEYEVGLATRTLKPVRASIIEEFFLRYARELEELGIEPLPKKPRWWNKVLAQQAQENAAKGGGAPE